MSSSHPFPARRERLPAIPEGCPRRAGNAFGESQILSPARRERLPALPGDVPGVTRAPPSVSRTYPRRDGTTFLRSQPPSPARRRQSCRSRRPSPARRGHPLAIPESMPGVTGASSILSQDGSGVTGAPFCDGNLTSKNIHAIMKIEPNSLSLRDPTRPALVLGAWRLALHLEP